MDIKIEGLPYYLRYTGHFTNPEIVFNNGSAQKVSIQTAIQFEALAKLDDIKNTLDHMNMI